VIKAHMAAMSQLPVELVTAYTALNDLALLVLSPDSPGILEGSDESSRHKLSQI
jgi:hypothetical protein